MGGGAPGPSLWAVWRVGTLSRQLLRQLPLVALLTIAAAALFATVTPDAGELGDHHQTADPAQRVRAHAIEYAQRHWGLTVRDPDRDVLVLDSSLLDFSLSHFGRNLLGCAEK